MPDQLKVTFTLGAKDVAHLKKIIKLAAQAASNHSAEEIVSGAARMAAEVRAAEPPDYVLERVDQLETIVELVRDKVWGVPTGVARRILAALAYFTNPADLIPDQTPGLGFLDDAIMIELVAQDLRHEIKAYREFARFRSSLEGRGWSKRDPEALEKRLVDKRKALRARVQEAAARDIDRARSRSERRLKLW